MKKVLYHGTKGNFNNFNFSLCGTATSDMSCTGGLGVWFTDSYDYAANYAENVNGSTIYAVLVDAGRFDNTWTPVSLESFIEQNGVEAGREIIESEGHNGIISSTAYGNEYCAFTAESIECMWQIEGPLSENEIFEIE